jgi:hypothetical protein
MHSFERDMTNLDWGYEAWSFDPDNQNFHHFNGRIMPFNLGTLKQWIYADTKIFWWSERGVRLRYDDPYHEIELDK